MPVGPFCSSSMPIRCCLPRRSTISNRLSRRIKSSAGDLPRRYDSSSWFLRITCLLAGLRTRWAGWFLGDQAIFIRREAFEQLGGFQDLDLFEDLDLSRRMARAGHVVTLFPPVISSSRRFRARGEVLTTVLDVWLTFRYLREPTQTPSPKRGALFPKRARPTVTCT